MLPDVTGVVASLHDFGARARVHPLAAFLVALSATACTSFGSPTLTPHRIGRSESDRSSLHVVGLAPEAYLERDSNSVRVVADLRVRVGGIDAAVLGTGDDGIEVRLMHRLEIGLYDLDVRARGRDFHASHALEVVADDDVEAGLADAGELDAGSVDSGAADASGFDAGTDASFDGGLDAGTDASSLPPLCPADPALVGCWPLDGDALDGSGRGNDLTASAVTWPASGGVLLGATSSLSRSARPELRHAGLSFDAWIRLDVMPASRRRSGVADHDLQFGIFVNAPNDLTCSATVVGAGSTPTPSPITLGIWHHIACVADAGVLSLYVDGAVVQTTVAAGGTVSDEPFHLGENSPDGADQWIGAIDDARIWDRALSPTEILGEVAIGRRIE